MALARHQIKPAGNFLRRRHPRRRRHRARARRPPENFRARLENRPCRLRVRRAGRRVRRGHHPQRLRGLHAAGLHLDAGTTGYQRVLGGILIPTLRCWFSNGVPPTRTAAVLEEKTLAGLARKMAAHLAVGAGQRARRPDARRHLHAMGAQNHQAGIVTAIIATTPLVLLPMTRIVEGEKIGFRSLLGALIAVGGVIGLTFSGKLFVS